MSLTGKRKLVWFSTLNNSPRNWSSLDSVRRIFLKADASQFTYPGPWTTFRPSSPNTSNLPRGSGWSCWKAFTLNHSCGVRGPEFGLPIRLGRFAEKPVISGACPCSETSFESNTVNGPPLMTVTIPFNCQLPKTCPYQLLECCRNGRAH